MSYYRLVTSIANIHNLLLLVVIVSFVYISVVPTRRRQPRSETARPSEEIQYIYEDAKLSIDLKPYEQLLQAYQALKSDYHALQTNLTSSLDNILAESRKDIVIKASLVRSAAESSLSQVKERQAVLAGRFERIQRRIKTSVATTRETQRQLQDYQAQLEKTGTAPPPIICPVINVAESSVYIALQERLTSAHTAIDHLGEQLATAKRKHSTNVLWLHQLKATLPKLKQALISSVTREQLTNNKLAAEQEIHTQLTDAKQQLQADLHRLWQQRLIAPETTRLLQDKVQDAVNSTFSALRQAYEVKVQAELEQQETELAITKMKKSDISPALKQSSTSAQHQLPHQTPLPHKTHHLTAADTAHQPPHHPASTPPPLADYALASAGTRVITAETSPTFYASSLSSSALGLHPHLGLGLFGAAPEDALTPTLTPGSCWPLQGDAGNLTVQFLHPIIISAITLDHIPYVNYPQNELPPCTLFFRCPISSLCYFDC